MPLAKLQVGQAARVAYIHCEKDQELHKLDSLQIRPGVVVTLHQRYPSYVIECEGGNIAMGEEIVSNISVWREPDQPQPADTPAPAEPREKRRGWRKARRRDKPGP